MNPIKATMWFIIFIQTCCLAAWFYTNVGILLLITAALEGVFFLMIAFLKWEDDYWENGEIIE